MAIHYVTVQENWQSKLLHRRGYCTALLESLPKPLQWRGPGNAFISMSHYDLRPLELWMWMSGCKIHPWKIENRWWMRVQSKSLVCLALRMYQPFGTWYAKGMREALDKLDTFPKHTWVREEASTAALFVGQPKEHYDGVSDEDMIYQRLGYCAAMLERTRTWYRWNNGHTTLQIRHHNPEPLQILARISHKTGEIDPAGGRWVLRMNNQDKIHRFLTIMKDFVIIPETHEAINCILSGQEPKKLLDNSGEVWYKEGVDDGPVSD